MKIAPILLIFLSYNTLSNTNFELFTKSPITNPSIGLRCNELIKKRESKIRMRQRLNEVLSKVFNLKKIAPKNKVQARKRLESIEAKTKKEIQLSNFKIQNLRRTLIKQGCPRVISLN